MKPGDVVYSKSGRDGGRYFAVVAVEDERFVRIADGDIRRLKNAKPSVAGGKNRGAHPANGKRRAAFAAPWGCALRPAARPL